VIRRAAKVDANQSEIVAALRTANCLVEPRLSTLGQGIPDLLVQGPCGNLYLMEVKDGNKPASKRKLTQRQVDYGNKGWNFHVVTNWAEALNVVAWRNPNLGTTMPNDGMK
jgi:hypothetical protein